jgi:hypothetical protein
MPWILLLLAALFTAPLSAAALPGVPTANADKTSASEPDVEQKRAAYAALADVLANDAARQELIDQLRKAAATPPPDSTPTLTPPAVKEETTVLENVTQISREYGESSHRAFPSCGAISPARRISPLIHKPLPAPPGIFYCWPGWCLPSGGWYASRRCRCIAKWANGDGIKTAIAETGSSCR